jgi:hypothetical protein
MSKNMHMKNMIRMQHVARHDLDCFSYMYTVTIVMSDVIKCGKVRKGNNSP